MLAKRAVLFAYDAFTLAVMAAIIVLGLAQPAWAYVDPSVMTYTIQALAGVVVALSAVAGVALRRTRRVILRALNIDENANKIVEPDVHRVDPVTREIIEGEEVFPQKQEAAKKEVAFKKAPGNLRWRTRLILALIASFFLFGTFFIVAPVEIVASSTYDLVLTVADVWGVLVVFVLLLTAVLGFLASALKGRAFDIALAVIVAIGVAAWLEVMFMNRQLPPADGFTVPWQDFTNMMVISALVWVAVIALLVAFAAKFRTVARGVCMLLCGALILIQGVGVASLWFGPNPTVAQHDEDVMGGNVMATQEGLFEVSPRSNVIVFVLDMFDTAQLEEDLQTDPSALDEFTGFTYFRDSAGSLIPTRYAVPYLLTAQNPQEDEEWSEFIEGRWQNSTFLQDINDAGYSVGLYSDSLGNGVNYIADQTVNVQVPQDEDVFSSIATAPGILKALCKCALYRDLPWLLKKPFWFYTDELNNTMVDMTRITPEMQPSVPYLTNDIAYYNGLTGIGLSATAEGEQGSFKFIHLLGAHYPYLMDDHAQPARMGETSMNEQSRGALFIVSEYLRQLKDLGLYDEATIIVTADHGYWYLNNGPVSYASSPIMLVKPSGSSDAPCMQSMQQTGHIDFQSTIIDAVGGDMSRYGGTVWDAPEAGRARNYYFTSCVGTRDDRLYEYRIDGLATDFSTWSLTGREIPIPSE